MSLSNKQREILQKIIGTRKEIKIFAWVLSSILIVMTVWFFYFERNIRCSIIISSLTVVILLIAFLRTDYLRPLYKIWMIFMVSVGTLSLWIFYNAIYFLMLMAKKIMLLFYEQESSLIKRLENKIKYWQQKKNFSKTLEA